MMSLMIAVLFVVTQYINHKLFMKEIKNIKRRLGLSDDDIDKLSTQVGNSTIC